jgi:hypothetical protein
MASSHHKAKKAPQLCCEPGCLKPRVVYGRCWAHFRALDSTLAARLRGMTRAQRKIEFERITEQSATPKWEYENEQGEAELAQQAAQERNSE